MRLLTCRIELAQGSDIGILLNGHCPLGRKIVSDPCRWREVEILEAADKGVIENGIHDDVHRMQVQSDDRPNLGCKVIQIPMFGVVTEFEIHGAKECAIVGMRRGEQQAYLAAIDRCAAVFRDTV